MHTQWQIQLWTTLPWNRKQLLLICRCNKICFLYLFAYWVTLHAICHLFFPNQLFRKFISKIPSECQTVWIWISFDDLTGLICVQTVCKSLLVDGTTRQIVVDGTFLRIIYKGINSLILTQPVAIPIADPGVVSLIPAQSITFVEIDSVIISTPTILLLPLIREGLVSFTREVLVNRLVKVASLAWP